MVAKNPVKSPSSVSIPTTRLRSGDVGTTFVGNILALASITMNSGATLAARTFDSSQLMLSAVVP
jgi:hypothetical protein